MVFEKRTRKFISGIDSAKAAAEADGIELTADEAAKAALRKALGSKKKPKKKRRGGSMFLPGSFESSSR
ncbi:hypothetical protein M6G63_09810 [Pseudomonas sp. BYT-5]|uniref:hypothetical protein n=1 Tax=unclassified Pseudomonas TaxID=196821 RepID=UPI00202078C0|nr:MULTISPECIES: hypothetical protein [unclassified Pseudomonas]URD44514.1 hypothetical protein M6G63_09810 [Pseudomonas sp. BYT-5]URK99840.1 hypothetical protein J5X93_09780 [Pseudomonas sp. BYT-1]